MRINQFVAQSTGLSRRASDKVIINGQITINDKAAIIGQIVDDTDVVIFDGRQIYIPKNKTILILNKPVGYVCSRNGQGSKTIYDLLPEKYISLKNVGRLDKDSSGIIILTNDGNYAQKNSHPSFEIQKIYSAILDLPLKNEDINKIESGKVVLETQPSIMKISLSQGSKTNIKVEIHEGRNRQIRRTFAALGYDVLELNREVFGEYTLKHLGNLSYKEV